ncbi:hydrogenase 3 maturation endopeptidase HyCI [Pelobacter propionicus]|uniref:Hydrogenase 3 maturation peptidase Hycl, Aspartic peptidase, MEROPS family A31 n=1 Tax=Pelobacter propionicus (strain DSM 2379 / NBRC 103807 / OttBd1) TaxID=338966 RepID=A1ALK9_PELPD|nr:hydrogenase 3 maturation endopeptidase HyCI [Pelobacter propionicus]ABK98229.1 Hydrogenase 3 maturation peptidase Hycl, Aspartic peptidase, MEROPS family A31 [Pelobacter propionicus DSM 2379]
MQRQMSETLKARLEGCRRVALLGIGSELRGDDAAGILVVREMGKLVSEGPFRCLDVAGFEGANAPENVTGYIRSYKPSHILVVDAAEIGAQVGFCREISISEISETNFSTHTLPLKVIADYLEQSTGADIVVLGIQPGPVGFAMAPTLELVTAVARVSHCLYGLFRECDRYLVSEQSASVLPGGRMISGGLVGSGTTHDVP